MAASPRDAAIPRRAAGVVPVGPLQDGGFVEQAWLVRRGEKFVQVSELLYRVLALVDGLRTREQIADELTRTSAWEVREDDVAALIERKLAPLGLAGTAEVSPVAQPSPRASVLQVNARLRVLGADAVDRVARFAQHLFRPPVLAVALVLVALSQVWFFAAGQPGRAIQEIVARPLVLPLLLGLLVVAGVFHEFGHAAALRYGGARARSMGVGWYLVAPVFYTDVTESYALSRRARARTDLGGIYFDLLAGVALLACYAMTGDDLFLVAVLLLDIDVARQLIPFIRLDGYWLLADLTGIPDLFTHAAPRLLQRLGIRRPGSSSPPLRPAARRILAAYIALTIPAIMALFAYVAWHAPTAVANAVTAIEQRGDILGDALGDGEVGTALTALAEMLLLVLPAFGAAALGVLLVVSAVALARRRPDRYRSAQGEPAYRVPAEAPSTPVSLAEAIAEHLELKRRHALEDGIQVQPAAVPTSTVDAEATTTASEAHATAR